MNVKRYTIEVSCAVDGRGAIANVLEKPDGEWVRWSDVEKIIKAGRLLRAEVEAWRAAWGSEIDTKGSGNWGQVTRQDLDDMKPLVDAQQATDAANAREVFE